MEISELIDAAARAAVEHETPSAPVGSEVYHNFLLQPARRALAEVGISNERLAAAITLAKAEERTAKLQSADVDPSPALKREIAHLRNII